MAAVMNNTFDSRAASAGPIGDMHSAPQRPSSAAPMPQQQHQHGYMHSSPLVAHDSSFAAPPAFKPFNSYTLPSPAPQSFIPPYSASYYPVFDIKSRTVSHAHPMYSADHTQSSRYSSSPPAHATHLGPPSAAPPTAQWQQTPHLQTPVLSVHEAPADSRQHINPSMISYSMARSASNTSDGDVHNLLTPHLGYREQISPAPQDMRKVSDSLRPFDNRYEPYPNYSQPGMQYWSRNAPPAPMHSFAERKEDVYDNDYERERAQQISGNKRLLEELGLGGGSGYTRQRHASNIVSRRPSMKKRLSTQESVRASPRIASIHRNVSYADLDDGRDDVSDFSGEDSYEEDDFRPSKRGRGFGKLHKSNHRGRKPDLSLWGLFQVYPQILELYPLFYYTLLNDLSINSESVPLIGSIANTVKPIDKADTLRNFFHRGRRVLAQLDAFTARCDRKYEGPLERWPEMDHHTRIAIRDVRRKVVERCENYKYTRRDILNKAMGKNNWDPIEANMIEWKYGQTNGDPAGDITHVSLTQPSMPAHLAMQVPPMQLPFASPAPQTMQMPYSHAGGNMPERSIRPMPSRARLNASVPRSLPGNMDAGSYTPLPQHSGLFTGAPFTSQASASAPAYPYSAMPPSAMHTPHAQHTPMYGEDQVPMSVQMPLAPMHHAPQQLATPQPISAMPSSILSSVPPSAPAINTWMPEHQQHHHQQQHQSQHGDVSPVDEIVASMAKSRQEDEEIDE